MLTLLNLPRHLRNRFSSILLIGIVPGNGTQEAHDLNPYIDIMVDEMLKMSSSKMFDAYQNAPFECKVSILLYILELGRLCQSLVLADTKAVRSAS